MGSDDQSRLLAIARSAIHEREFAKRFADAEEAAVARQEHPTKSLTNLAWTTTHTRYTQFTMAQRGSRCAMAKREEPHTPSAHTHSRARTTGK